MIRWTLCALVLAAGCNERVDGLAPIGGGEASPAQVERFVRRAHLDLTGRAADADTVEQASADILAAQSSTAARDDFVRGLLESQDFADFFVDEVEGRTFAGEGYEDGYALACGIARQSDPACADCAAPPSGDVCGGCSCERVTSLLAERDALDAAASELHAGDLTTAQVERRFAESEVYRSNPAPVTATNLFNHFLGRPPEADELANAQAIIIDLVLVPGGAAGLLFHRHGAGYDDLVDIVFGSEVYREAAVARVFERYLGRRPGAAELAHFRAQLDADRPDVTPVIEAVLSSAEYFGQ